MKKDPWAGVLTVVLVATTLGAAAKCFQYLKLSSQNRALNANAAVVSQRRAVLNSFAIELGEYAKAHPAVEPVINHINLRAQTGTNSIQKRP